MSDAPLNGTEFVTSWSKIRTILSEHPSELPRSALACSMFDYLEATIRVAGENKSVVMVSGGKPIAALIGWADKDGWNLLDRPAFVEFASSTDNSASASHITKCLTQFIWSNLNPNQHALLSFVEDGNFSTILLRALMANCTSHQLTFEGILSLDSPIEEIVKGFRSGHRQSVKQGKQVFGTCQIYGKNTSPSVFSSFRALHKKSAGRVTRGDESWEEMLKGLHDSRAYLTVVRLEDEIVGCSYFWVTQHSATYGSAAYNRNYFSQFPISHFALFGSFEHFRKIGIKRVMLGKIFIPQGSPKEQSVAAFKRGFTQSMELLHTVRIQK